MTRTARHARAFVASICLAAQAFALAHLFLVVHRRCDEHGDVVHGDVAHGDHRRDKSDGRYAVFGVGSDAADADHDHCQTFAEPRDSRIAQITDVAAIAGSIVDLPTMRATPVATRPLYRLAPKASPPHWT